MKTRTGRVYWLAIMAFAAGLVLASPPTRAQNQDSPKLYVTPGAPQDSHPLFLKRLFGAGSAPNAGVGRAKPYDFSQKQYIERNTVDAREMTDKFNAENKAKFDAVIDERKKAIAAMYAQTHAQLKQEAQTRRQAEQQKQAQLNEAARQIKVTYRSLPKHHKPPRPARPASQPRAAITGQPPVYFNGQQQQNAHPPIFLH